jgi:hypothetical protein
VLRRGRLSLLAFVAVVGVLAAVFLSSASAAPAQQPARPAKLSVGVQVLRFTAAGRKLSATSLVTATLTDSSGHRTISRSKVALTAATATGGCKILHLFLNELNLSLLGLNAHLDKVQLDVTGNARGGVLGSLFCKLAHAKVAFARAGIARAMTVAVRHDAGHVVRFTVNLSPTATTSAAANPTCSVLDLVVGPLDVQLLGLQVDLNRVHLVITATRGAGTLGDLFCQLADNNPATPAVTR